MRMILWMFVLWGLLVAAPDHSGRTGGVPPVADGATGVPPIADGATGVPPS